MKIQYCYVMIEHIILFKLQEAHKYKAGELKAKLDQMKSKIDVIRELETGINITERHDAFDVFLRIGVRDKYDLRKYQDHPVHQEVVQYVKSVVSETALVDYLK